MRKNRSQGARSQALLSNRTKLLIQLAKRVNRYFEVIRNYPKRFGRQPKTQRYLTTPLPSVTTSFRSTLGILTTSDAPSGHLISTLSKLVNAPRPKCKVISFCEE